MDESLIVAMAVACIAEENGVDIKDVVVKNFREVQKSPLAQYIADNNITYHKYQLGE
ncbi:MAG: hypothetical protein IKM72_03475 [Oscillospiraceae bacterium]|nr:hypothetical protein [Oscillospiraceae bacterium]